MLRKIFVLLVFYTAIFANVFGQNTSEIYSIPKITPPSPNASSLGKYGDIPVGEYTGIPNVSIPLYTIQVGKYSLPISLSYHSQGLKVEERAGWVGLGWSLNAGGVITRSTHGLADEGGGGFLGNSGYDDNSIANLTDVGSFCSGSFYDMQPDIFYYNFGTSSGKFILDQTPVHNAHFIPFQSIKLSYQLTLGKISQFQIVDENGIIYIFSTVETTTDNGAQVVYFNSAWYLTQIVTPYGAINFNYTQETTTSVQFTESNFLNVNGAGDENQYNPGYSSSSRNLSNESVILSSIDFPNGHVVFQSGDRNDYGAASDIVEMDVNDVNNNSQKKFEFDYFYLGDNGSNNPEDVRLALSGVTQFSNVDDASKTYYFNYYSPENVPSVKSLAQDSWGFYNGHDENQSLLPFIDPAVYGPYIANQATFHGNRDVDPESAQAGLLQSIVYPTGGITTFVYEGNDYSYVNGTPVSSYQTSQLNAVSISQRSNIVNFPTNTAAFSITNSQTGTLHIDGSYTGPAPVDNGPTVIVNRINSDGSRTNIYTLYMVNNVSDQFPQLDPGDYELVTSVDGTGQQITATMTYIYTDQSVVVHRFPCGGVRISQVINHDIATNTDYVKQYQYVSDSDPSLSSGNLNSQPITLERVSSYTWNAAYDMESSSSLAYMGSTQGSHIGYGIVSESEIGSVSNGKTVSYFNANDYGDAAGTTHRVISQGLVQNEGLNSVMRYKTDYGVYRGLPTKVLVYNSDNVLLKSSTTTYNISGSMPTDGPNYFEVTAMAGYSTQICHTNCLQCRCTASGSGGGTCPSCNNYELDNFTWTDFKVVCPWIYKTSTDDILYDQFGSNPIEQQVQYYYDNPAHGFPTRIVKTNSKNQIVTTQLKYPQDGSLIADLNQDASDALTEMVNLNIIAPVIETDQFVGENLISSTRTDYKIWNPSSNLVQPQHILSRTLSNPWQNRLDYDGYDQSANVLQVSKSGDVKHCYLWAYNGSVPVAEIIGSSYLEIQQAMSDNNISQVQLDNAISLSDDQLRTLLASLRSALPASLIKTFTFSPLIGQTSETDPAGHITYFEYDGLGRLKNVRDQSGNIIKKYEYHFFDAPR